MNLQCELRKAGSSTRHIHLTTCTITVHSAQQNRMFRTNKQNAVIPRKTEQDTDKKIRKRCAMLRQSSVSASTVNCLGAKGSRCQAACMGRQSDNCVLHLYGQTTRQLCTATAWADNQTTVYCKTFRCPPLRTQNVYSSLFLLVTDQTVC
jgi:hypothetical protein